MTQAKKDLDGFYGRQLAVFEKVIIGLASEPRPRNTKKLAGGGSRWRIKQGDYRILYEIDDQEKTVTVYRVVHRREAYR
jgi:mRNA interferase RelE/StbE